MLEGKKIEIKVGGEYDPIPMDKYTVQIANVDAVTQFNKFKGVEQEVLNFQYVILDEKPMPEGKETTRGRYLWHRVTPVLSGKSWLMKLAKAVYGRDLTREEQENFDPEDIVCKQVDVMVEQKPSADGSVVYNNIVAYSKTVKELEPDITDQREHKAEVTKESEPAEIPWLDLGEDSPDLDSAFAKKKK